MLGIVKDYIVSDGHMVRFGIVDNNKGHIVSDGHMVRC